MQPGVFSLCITLTSPNFACSSQAICILAGSRSAPAGSAGSLHPVKQFRNFLFFWKTFSGDPFGRLNFRGLDSIYSPRLNLARHSRSQTCQKWRQMAGEYISAPVKRKPSGDSVLLVSSKDSTKRTRRTDVDSVLRSLRHGGYGEIPLGCGHRPYHND